MQKQIRIFIPYILLTVTTFVSVFFFFQSTRLQNQLEASQANKQSGREVHNTTLFKQLLAIDTLLIEGKYAAAQQAHEALHKAAQTDNAYSDAINVRVALIRKLVSMNRKLQAFEGAEPYSVLSASLLAKRQQVDSLIVRSNTLERLQRDQLDSLRFAIEKAHMRTESLAHQLAHTYDKDYLKFTGSEGIEVYYVGEVKDQKAHGKGAALYSTGSRYEGEWKNNEHHGKGVYYWPDGEYYKGSFQEGQRHGRGNYYWPNGDMFTGEWKNDKRNGEGTFYGKEGKTVVSGVWQHNELVQRSE